MNDALRKFIDFYKLDFKPDDPELTKTLIEKINDFREGEMNVDGLN